MQITDALHPVTNASVLSRPIAVLLLFRNHLPDYSFDHLSVCHLSQAYGKDVPETAKEICKACRPKSIGMFYLRIDIWHHGE